MAVKKAPKVKLNEKQLVTMAAILGLSNAGQDGLFKGPRASVTPDDVQDFYTSPRSSGTIENAVIRFGNGIFETDEMLVGFVDEAKAWVKTLKNKSIDEIKKTWADYAPFVDAIAD